MKVQEDQNQIIIEEILQLHRLPLSLSKLSVSLTIDFYILRKLTEIKLIFKRSPRLSFQRISSRPNIFYVWESLSGNVFNLLMGLKYYTCHGKPETFPSEQSSPRSGNRHDMEQHNLIISAGNGSQGEPFSSAKCNYNLFYTGRKSAHFHNEKAYAQIWKK